MRRLRTGLLAVATLLATAALPARAADPTVLVASTWDGGLVRIELVGRVATVETLAPAREGVYLIPTQANGAAVSYVTATEEGPDTRFDVGVIDAGSGKRRALSRDGRSGHVLVSRDGTLRYVSVSDKNGTLTSIVRVDARGRRKTLVPAPAGKLAGTAFLSGSGLTRDGRTLFVAQTVSTNRSRLYAVDTATGARREIQYGGGHDVVFNVVASPDGSRVAVSYVSYSDPQTIRVAVVPVRGGERRELDSDAGLHASAFTVDGTAVVLSGYGHPVDLLGLRDIWLGDVATGLVTPIAGTTDLFQAVAVA